MKSLVLFGRKLQRLCSFLCMRMYKYIRSLLNSFYSFVATMTPFWIEFCYILSLSTLGFSFLKVLKTKTNFFRPRNIDLFFMSVSSVTVASMSTVDMEVFSNPQLVLMTILILLGGEVFTSMLQLQFTKSDYKVDVTSVSGVGSSSPDQIEFGLVPMTNSEDKGCIAFSDSNLKFNSIRYLSYVVVGYLLVFLVGGSILVMLYISFVPSASDVLKNKGLELQTFSVFTVVSTFSSCGFVPTNENMIVFKHNPGLLLLLIPQALVGNTLYPSLLLFVIWGLKKITRREEFEYMLHNTRDMAYDHLLPIRHSLLLALTVVGFILVQFVMFCCLEWNSYSFGGMSWYQKVVGAAFQVVNARHTGESIVDLSTISPAILTLFVFMMYLPPSTAFLPNEDDDKKLDNKEKKRRKLGENLLFSPLSYLVICVVLICITESKDLKNDALNFSVFNIIFEVVSAYGGVGFSTGYSCKRQINKNPYCEDVWYGFSGRWSNEGKMILICVMVMGRLKKYNIAGGKAWKLK